METRGSPSRSQEQGCGVGVGVMESESEGILGGVGVGRNFMWSRKEF
jgi:hypothetical protein